VCADSPSIGASASAGGAKSDATTSAEADNQTKQEDKPVVKPPWHVRMLNFFMFMYDITVAFVYDHFIMLCFLQFLLVGLTGRPNAMEIRFFGLFVCFVVVCR
jgi:hypothetical protein